MEVRLQHFCAAAVVCLVITLIPACNGAPVAPQLLLSKTFAENPLLQKWNDDSKCQLCMVITGILQSLGKSDIAEEDVAKFLEPVCGIYRDYDDYVCSLAIEEFKHEVLTVAEYLAFGPERLVCNALLGPSCSAPYDPFHQYWNVTIPGGKPQVVTPSLPKVGAPVNRILHISDIHWDQNYTVGLNKDCGEPVCCRPPNAPSKPSPLNKDCGEPVCCRPPNAPSKPSPLNKDCGEPVCCRPPNAPMTNASAARRWGETNCDLPWATLEDLMQHLADNKDKFDWVYVTGDLPAHNVWKQTRDDQTFIISNISATFKQYLPDKKIYFALGNHEGVPVDSFPPPFAREEPGGVALLQWLLDLIAEVWSPWLSDSSLTTLQLGGFYSEKVLDKLRVISLNMMFGDNTNFWLLINDTDPFGQLDWLVRELLDAEQAGDKVHIIGHIPPSGTTYAFSRNYHRIVNRFESTIVGQFFGHTHKDEFEVFFDDVNTTRATSVALIAPSITPVNIGNGGYRIYTIDGDYSGTTRAVLDFDATYINISDANIQNKTNWQDEYSAKDTYNLFDLQPASWADLVQRFKTDDSLFQQFYRYKYKLSNPTGTCTGNCKSSELCDLLTSQSGDSSHCKQFLTSDISMDDIRAHMEKFRTRC